MRTASIERVCEAPEVYRVHVPLRGSALTHMNSYIVRDGRDALIIDTGFDRPECRNAILAALSALSVEPARAALFLTHFHSDHIGSFYDLLPDSNPRYMSAADKACMQELSGQGSNQLREALEREGLPCASFRNYLDLFLGSIGDLTAARRIRTVRDGEPIPVGSRTLTAILTPGHTPGHMCLYDAESQTLFLGDLVLFDISPNVCFLPGRARMLAQFFESLERVRRLEVSRCLPAHREGGDGAKLRARIEELYCHHCRRLADIERALSGFDAPPTAYDIARSIPWQARLRGFDSLTQLQAFFAQEETLAHLEWLADEGAAERILAEGGVRYRLLEPLGECSLRERIDRQRTEAKLVALP